MQGQALLCLGGETLVLGLVQQVLPGLGRWLPGEGCLWAAGTARGYTYTRGTPG